MTVGFTQTSNVRWYDGDPTGDGCGMGKTASSKIGFHGATPVVQAAAITSATATATNAAATANAILTALRNLGLVAT